MRDIIKMVRSKGDFKVLDKKVWEDFKNVCKVNHLDIGNELNKLFLLWLKKNKKS